MEVNFSNKQEDEDELENKITPAELSGDARLIKADSMDIIDDSDLRGVVQGMPPEDIKIVEKMKILEEQKDTQKKGPANVKQTPGRGKLQNNTAEPKIQTPMTKKEQNLKAQAG